MEKEIPVWECKGNYVRVPSQVLDRKVGFLSLFLLSSSNLIFKRYFFFLLLLLQYIRTDLNLHQRPSLLLSLSLSSQYDRTPGLEEQEKEKEHFLFFFFSSLSIVLVIQFLLLLSPFFFTRIDFSSHDLPEKEPEEEEERENIT